MSDDIYHLSAKDIDAMEGLAKTHFLNPKAQRVNKSLGDVTGLTGFGFHIIEVEPGFETTEHHVHHHEDECVFVLEGHATARIGEDRVEIGPGDFIGYRKGGLAHTIENTGDQTLRMIVVGERLAHDVGDYPDKQKRIYRQVGLAWNVVDHADIHEPTGAGKK